MNKIRPLLKEIGVEIGNEDERLHFVYGNTIDTKIGEVLNLIDEIKDVDGFGKIVKENYLSVGIDINRFASLYFETYLESIFNKTPVTI